MNDSRYFVLVIQCNLRVREQSNSGYATCWSTSRSLVAISCRSCEHSTQLFDVIR